MKITKPAGLPWPLIILFLGIAFGDGLYVGWLTWGPPNVWSM